MEPGFLLGLVIITLAAIGGVIGFGVKLAAIARRRPGGSDLLLNITPTGNAVFACMVAFWIACAVARVFEPESGLGAVARRPDGMLALILASILVVGLASAVLGKLGFPLVKTHEDRDR